MRILSFGATDPGKKRANNEDAYLVNDELGLYAVADGVGGNEAGEVASRIAVETIAEAMPDLLGEKDRTPPSEVRSGDVPELSALQEAVLLANRIISEEAATDPCPDRHGNHADGAPPARTNRHSSPISATAVPIFSGRKRLQLTDDHSFVAEQVRSGTLTPEQARTSPYRHMITRALGIDPEAAPDLMKHALQPGDRFLLCTDGLTEMVSDAEIGKILAASSPQEAVQKLMAAANEQGGVDNITAVVVWVRKPDLGLWKEEARQVLTH